MSLRATVHLILPDLHGRTARRLFRAWSTRLTVDQDVLTIDGGHRGERRLVPVEQVQYVKVRGANPLPVGWTTVEVATRSGGRLLLSVMRSRRLLGALRATGCLELFTNPAWPGVVAAAKRPEDVEWSNTYGRAP